MSVHSTRFHVEITNLHSGFVSFSKYVKDKIGKRGWSWNLSMLVVDYVLGHGSWVGLHRIAFSLLLKRRKCYSRNPFATYIGIFFLYFFDCLLNCSQPFTFLCPLHFNFRCFFQNNLRVGRGKTETTLKSTQMSYTLFGYINKDINAPLFC